MAHYLLYWKPEGVADSIGPLHWAASTHMARVSPGDVLWAVSMPRSGEFELVSRIEVQRVTQSEGEVREHIGRDDFWRADWYALGPREAALPNQHIPITDVLREVRFEGDRPELPQAPDPIHAMNIRAMRRISDDSVALLEETWDEAVARQPIRRRNPPWQRDELILALDLYMRLGRRVADDTDPEVINLSELLNKLPIHTNRPDEAKFRNPNGVGLKLANFRAIEQPGHGMSRGSRLDLVVWNEFVGDENPTETGEAKSGQRLAGLRPRVHLNDWFAFGRPQCSQGVQGCALSR